MPRRSLIFILHQNTMGGYIAAHIAALGNRILPLMISSHMDASLRDALIETYHPEFLWMPEWLLKDFEGREIVARKYDYVLVRTGYTSQAIGKDGIHRKNAAC